MENLPEGTDTWENLSDLFNLNSMIEEFDERSKSK